jgi:glycosyltransferase involved in cell wall biosynthesis
MGDGRATQQGVAVVCGRLWGNAAVENRARLEIRSFRDAGLPVEVLTQQPVDDHARAAWPDLVALPPVISEPGRAAAGRTFTKLLALVSATGRFLGGARGRRVHTVVSHSEAGVVGALWWRWRCRGRLVYVCHTGPRPKGAGLPRRYRLLAHLVHELLEWVALRAADLVVCPAPSSRDHYATRRPSKPTIALVNPVDLDRFSPEDSVLRDIDVLFVGRLAEEKGPAVLLEALVASAVPRRTVVAGQGSERARLETLAARCPGSVELPGVVPNEDLPSWYRRARVVVVPSFTEAAGMVPVEAMASGTPVVASSVGGLVDTVIDGENGWLVPPGDSVALATVLDRVLADDDLLASVGGAAHQSVGRFDAHTFGPRAIAAYGLDRA